MYIKELPFFYKSHTQRDNGGEKSILPFSLYFDDKLKLFKQKATGGLDKILQRVYEQGSLVDGSISSDSGKIYIPKLIKFICDNYQIKQNARILEVGCGSGILLKELRGTFSEPILVGVDPGDHELVAGLKDIKIVNDFFPSESIKEKFDLIYSFCVLEHIEDSETFLRHIINNLEENGKVILGVPDCEPFLVQGDVSIFIHEHFNYFTRENLSSLVRRVNLNVEQIEVVEGMILLTASRNSSRNATVSVSINLNEQDFFKRAQSNALALNSILSRFDQKDIAVYVPGRALNMLFLLDKRKVRLVDDNKEMHGKFLPCLDSPIESFEDLIINPPKIIFIYSRVFGERIKQRCSNYPVFLDVPIYTINDMNG